MNPHTIADMFIMLVIFLALIISLCVLAWRYPTLCHVTSMHGAALPTTNMALPVHSITTRRRSFSYLLGLSGMSFMIRWWSRASHNRTDRIPSIMISHREDTVALAGGSVRLYSTRTLTPTPTLTPTFLEGASTISTLVGSEAIELREPNGIKGMSTSSLAGNDDADPGEPIIHVRVGLVSEAIEPSHLAVCPILESDIADVDIMTIGDRSSE